jgi:hypothetical protein
MITKIGIMRLICLFVLFLPLKGSSIELEKFGARILDSSDYRYRTTLKAYNVDEVQVDWQMWSKPIGTPEATSCLTAQGKNKYLITNLIDYNLSTAWIEADTGYGLGESFSFTINYQDGASFATAYEFYGVINIFNGYCKSLKTWEENSRVKSLKVSLNNKPLCYIQLLDTWQFQTVDISLLFKNRYMKTNMQAPHEIKQGDNLKFEIVEVYPGSKYKDTAISGFFAEGAKN